MCSYREQTSEEIKDWCKTTAKNMTAKTQGGKSQYNIIHCIKQNGKMSHK